MAKGVDWSKVREAVLNEETFFHGNMRMCVIRIPPLLKAPDLVNYLYRLYSGNKTALTIKPISHLAPSFCGLFPDPHERFRHVEELMSDSLLIFA
jgi:hypothetical protein